jgi:DNA-binding beta-propeller fold protein YncE
VAVSPDGQNVYVTSLRGNAVVVFDRVAGGALVPRGCIANNPRSAGNPGGGGPTSCNSADGLAGATGVTVSPDGKDVYVVSSTGNAVVAFRRAAGGGLQPIGCIGNRTGSGNTGKPGPESCDGTDGLAGATDIAVSPDGENAYVAGNVGNAIVAFKRLAFVPPTITSAALRPNKFTTGTGPGGGGTFDYVLSERAVVTFTISRKSANGYDRVGTFIHQSTVGKNRYRFRGRVKGVPLTPGSYHATLQATDADGLTSQPKTVVFVVVPS